jgi:hypothetical protein
VESGRRCKQRGSVATSSTAIVIQKEADARFRDQAIERGGLNVYDTLKRKWIIGKELEYRV